MVRRGRLIRSGATVRTDRSQRRRRAIGSTRFGTRRALLLQEAGLRAREPGSKSIEKATDSGRSRCCTEASSGSR
jgi:hypothetical protein